MFSFDVFQTFINNCPSPSKPSSSISVLSLSFPQVPSALVVYSTFSSVHLKPCALPCLKNTAAYTRRDEKAFWQEVLHKSKRAHCLDLFSPESGTKSGRRQSPTDDSRRDENGLLPSFNFWMTMIPEVIREIFQYFSTPLHLHESNSFPWYLGHICTSWRAVFLTMPLHFWNKLDINLDFMDNLYNDPLKRKARYELMLCILRFFLNRTNHHPFSFQLERRFQCLEGEEDYIGSMLEMLIAESTRWEDVFIRYQQSHVPILYRARNHLPLLRSVQLLRSRFDGEHSLGHDLLDGASCLRSVSIADLCDWRMDWGQLRVLKIGQFHQGERLLSVLSQAKQLEKLAIYQSFSGFDLEPSAKLLTFNSLKVMTITEVGLLSIFYAPCLEELYINGWDDEGTVDNAITSFLLVSSCRLKRFGMAGCSAASLSIILRHTPDLIHLNLDNETGIVRSFDDLIFHRQRRNKLPAARHLQSLTLMDSGLSDLELMELCTLLASRARRIIDDAGDVLVEKLRRLSIVMLDRSAQYRGRGVVERLTRQCQGQGVQLTIDEAVHMPWPRHDNTRILDW